jgi:hypothetical protein
VIRGTRNAQIVLDFANGVDTATGKRTHRDDQGATGSVLKAGRVVSSIEDNILEVRGILAGDVAELCPYFGVGA